MDRVCLEEVVAEPIRAGLLIRVLTRETGRLTTEQQAMGPAHTLMSRRARGRGERNREEEVSNRERLQACQLTCPKPHKHVSIFLHVLHLHALSNSFRMILFVLRPQGYCKGVARRWRFALVIVLFASRRLRVKGWGFASSFIFWEHNCNCFWSLCLHSSPIHFCSDQLWEKPGDVSVNWFCAHADLLQWKKRNRVC